MGICCTFEHGVLVDEIRLSWESYGTAFAPADEPGVFSGYLFHEKGVPLLFLY